MILNYQSHHPFVNNFSQAILWNVIQAETNSAPDAQIPVTKVLSIGGDGISDVFNNPDTFGSLYKKKFYQTQSVADYFSSWSFKDFEEQYQAQTKLVEGKISFLKKSSNGYNEDATKATIQQYTDLFFIDDLAFPVSDIYLFFNGDDSKREDAITEKRQEFDQIVQKNIKENPKLRKELRVRKENQDLFAEEDDEDDLETLKGQTGPVDLRINRDSETMIVDIEQILKIADFTYNPIVRGRQVHIPWQEAVIYETSRRVTVVGSRQGGKSNVMAARALCSSFKGYRRDTLVAAFENEATQHIQKYLYRMIENFPEGTFVFNKMKNWVTNTITGSRVIFRSLSKEADRIRGWTLHEVIMDECYLISDMVYKKVICPTVSTTGGSIFMISTPGPKNWFYWEVVHGQQNKKGYAPYQFTIVDNPFITDEEREDIMSQQSDPSIQQEYFCQFSDDANAVFRPIKTIDLTFFNRYKGQSGYVFAYDPARKGKDRAGYVCFQIADGKVFVLRSGFIPDQYKATWKTQFEWMKKFIFSDGHPYEIVVDCTGVGDSVVTLMQDAAFKVNMAIQYVGGDTERQDENWPYGNALAMVVGKSRLINNAQDYLDESITSFYKFTNEHLFVEMDSISEKKTLAGKKSFTTKGFDDITNAMMIGLYYIEHRNMRTRKYRPLSEVRGFVDDAYLKVKKDPKDPRNKKPVVRNTFAR